VGRAFSLRIFKGFPSNRKVEFRFLSVPEQYVGWTPLHKAADGVVVRVGCVSFREGALTTAKTTHTENARFCAFRKVLTWSSRGTSGRSVPGPKTMEYKLFTPRRALQKFQGSAESLDF